MAPQDDCPDTLTLIRPRPQRRLLRAFGTWLGVVVMIVAGLAAGGRMRLSGDSSFLPSVVVWIVPVGIWAYFAMRQRRARGALRTSTAAIAVLWLFAVPSGVILAKVDPLGVGSTLHGSIILAWCAAWYLVVLAYLRRTLTKWGRMLVAGLGILIATSIAGALVEIVTGRQFSSQAAVHSFVVSDPWSAASAYSWVPLLLAITALLIATVVFAATLPLQRAQDSGGSGEQAHQPDAQ